MLRAVLLLCLMSGVAIGETPIRVLYSRLGPVKTGVFVADGDGAHERALVRPDSLDYNASFSTDGKWIVFTSERNGSADIYRVHPDGEGLERLTDDTAFDDQAALSPDGSTLAFVSTRDGGFANIWLLDLATRRYPASGQNQCRKFPAELVARQQMDCLHLRSRNRNEHDGMVVGNGFNPSRFTRCGPMERRSAG